MYKVQWRCPLKCFFFSCLLFRLGWHHMWNKDLMAWRHLVQAPYHTDRLWQHQMIHSTRGSFTLLLPPILYCVILNSDGSAQLARSFSTLTLWKCLSCVHLRKVEFRINTQDRVRTSPFLLAWLLMCQSTSKAPRELNSWRDKGRVDWTESGWSSLMCPFFSCLRLGLHLFMQFPL